MIWRCLVALAMSCAALRPVPGVEIADCLTPPETPAGRVLTIEEAATLRGESFQETLYLVGSFRVTASGQHRMVLRGDGFPHVRLVVDLAEGLVVPEEGTIVSKDAETPFRVERVRLGNDNQITVYARDDGSQFRNE